MLRWGDAPRASARGATGAPTREGEVSIDSRSSHPARSWVARVACVSFGPHRRSSVEFTFISSIYVLGCGHSLAVRSTHTSELGTAQSCRECATEQVIVDIVTLGR
jgi:hypothetical protein